MTTVFGSNNATAPVYVNGELTADAGANLNTSALSLENGHIASVDAKLPVPVANRLPVDGSGVVQPISVAALPLPALAATSSNQTLEIAALSVLATAALQPALNADGGALAHVTNFPAVQTVIGNVVANTGLLQPATDAQMRAAALVVAGTVNIGNLPPTLIVDSVTLALNTTVVATNTALAQLHADVVTNHSDLGIIHSDLAAILTKQPALPALATGQAAINADGGSQVHLMNPVANQTVSGTVAVAVLDVALSTRLKPADTLAGVALVGAVTAITNPVIIGGTTAVSAVSLPLPSGAATATKQDSANTALQTLVTNSPTLNSGSLPVVGTVVANIGNAGSIALDSSLQSILTAIKATVSLTGTVWYDATAVPVIFYVRREIVNEGTGVFTISWETPAGGNATPVIANLQAVSDTKNLSNTTITYTASATNTGYSLGDILVHAFGLDTSTTPVTVAYSLWLNASSGSLLTTPPSAGSYVQPSQLINAASLPLPAGASVAALQPALNSDGGALAHVTNFPTVIIANAGTNLNTSALALDVTSQALVTGLNLLHTDATTNHSDLVTVHSDIGNTAHSDLAAILAKLPANPAIATNIAAINTDGGQQVHLMNPITNGALDATVQATNAALGVQHADLQAILAKQPTLPALASNQPALNTDGGSLSHVTNFPTTIIANAGTNLNTSALALDTSVQSALGALNTLHTDVALNHTDLVTLHTDIGSTAHADLQAILAKQPSAPALAVGQSTINADGGSQVHVMNLPLVQAVSGSAAIGSPPVAPPLSVSGIDSSGNKQHLTVNTTGRLLVDGSGITLSVAGAVTNTNLDVALSTRLKPADTLAGVSVVTAVTSITNPIAVAGIIPISAASLPLPSNASTASAQATSNGLLTTLTNNSPALQSGSIPVVGTVVANIGTPGGLGLDTSLQSILAAIKATVTISGSLWYDPLSIPTVYYVRRENTNQGTGVVTISWETPAGSVAYPTTANLQSVSNAQNITTTTLVYTAIAGPTAPSTGYVSGDTLIHSFGLNTSSTVPTLAYSMWLNAGPSVIIGTILPTSPTANTYIASVQSVVVNSSALPLGAATLLAQTTANTSLQTLVSNSPALIASRVPVDGSAVIQPVSGSAAIGNPPVSPPLSVSGIDSSGNKQHLQINNGRLLTDGSGAVQPVSVGTLPLPSGAATAANQGLEITALGLLSTAAKQPSLNSDGGALAHVTNFPTVIIANAGTNLNTSALALDATVQLSNTALATLHTDLTVNHADLQAILAKQPTAPALAANQSTINSDGGSQVHLMNPIVGGALDTTVQATNAALALNHTDLVTLHTDIGTTTHADLQAILAKQPAAPALAIGQATINADGGSQVHLMNPVAVQAVSGTVSVAVLDVALSTRLKPADTLAGVTLVNTVTSITNPVAIAGTVAVSIATLPTGSATATAQATTNTLLTTLSNNSPTLNSGSLPVVGTVVANIGTVGTLALDSSLQSILSVLKSTIDIAGSIWFDPTVNPVVYYLRRESVNEGTGVVSVSWFTPAGVSATPTTANLQAVSNAQNISNENITFTASQAGTGFSTNDILIHAFGIDTAITPAVVVYSIWLNASTSATLTTNPTTGSYTQISQTVNGSVSINNYPTSQAVTGSFYQTTQPVSGTAAIGSPPVAPPLSVSGIDASGNKQHLTIASTGKLLVDGSGVTLTVAGAVTNSNLDVALSTRLKPADTLAGVSLVTAVTSITNPVSIAGTIPISATALPLPTGAATSVAQATSNTALQTLVTNSPTLVSARMPVDPSGVTSPVSMASVPVGAALETGNLASILAKLIAAPATSANQATINTDGGSQVHLMNPVTGGALDTTAQATNVALATNHSDLVSIHSDIGTTTHADLQAILAKQPSAPALASNQSTINVDGGSQVHVMNLPSTQTVSGTVAIAALDVALSTRLKPADTLAGVTLVSTVTSITNPIAVSGTVAVAAASLPLPAGAATATAQTTGNTALQTLVTNSPTLVSNRVPVDGSGVTQPVSGTVTVLPGTGLTGLALETGNLASILAKLITAPATAAGQATINVDGGSQVHLMNAVTVNAGTNTSTASLALETGGNLAAIVAKLPTLVSARTPVDPSGVTSPVSMASVPVGAALETGNLASILAKLTATPSTSTAQTTGNVSLASIDSKTPALGSAVMTASIPVTIASNQPAIAVTQGNVGADGSISASGVSQTLFSGVTPTNGFAVYNPSATSDFWVATDGMTAAPNGVGSIRCAANGGGWEPPAGYKSSGAISVYGTAGQPITAKKW